MTTDNGTPIAHTIWADNRRHHARSRMADRLFGIFDQLYATAREARDSGADYNDPLLQRLAGSDDLANGSALQKAMHAVCAAACEMLHGEHTYRTIAQLDKPPATSHR